MKIIFIFTGIIGLMLTISRVVAFEYLINLNSSIDSFSLNDLNDLKKINTFIGDDPTYVLTLSKAFVNNGFTYQAIATLKVAKEQLPQKDYYYYTALLNYQNKNYASAEMDYIFIINSYPYLMYPKYCLALFYYNTHQIQKFNKYYLIIEEFKPRVVSEKTNQMKLEIFNLNKYLNN